MMAEELLNGGNLALIASVPGHCLCFNLNKSSSTESIYDFCISGEADKTTFVQDLPYVYLHR